MWRSKIKKVQMWDKARRTSYSYLDICRYGQKLNRLLITTYLTKLVRALSKENCQNMIFHKSYKLSIYMLSYFDSFMHLIRQLHILIIVIWNELLKWFYCWYLYIHHKFRGYLFLKAIRLTSHLVIGNPFLSLYLTFKLKISFRQELRIP